MPDIRFRDHVRLHLYTPRTTYPMTPCDDLAPLSVPAVPQNWTPPWAPMDQLHICAGQFCLSDSISDIKRCRFLGIHTGDRPADNVGSTAVRYNGFNPPGAFDTTGIERTCDGAPLPFVIMMRLAIRVRGVGFAETHHDGPRAPRAVAD